MAEYKQIVFEENGKEISDEQALEDATAFLQAFKVFMTGIRNNELMSKDIIEIKASEVLNETESTR